MKTTKKLLKNLQEIQQQCQHEAAAALYNKLPENARWWLESAKSIKQARKIIKGMEYRPESFL